METIISNKTESCNGVDFLWGIVTVRGVVNILDMVIILGIVTILEMSTIGLKEQDTQTNQQTHTHHHLCRKFACYLNTLKSFKNIHST